MLHGTAVTTAALHTYTAAYLDMGRKRAKAIVFDEDSCSSKLASWQQFALERKHTAFDFEKSVDGPYLKELWELHTQIVEDLMEVNGCPPDPDLLESNCDAVWSPVTSSRPLS